MPFRNVYNFNPTIRCNNLLRCVMCNFPFGALISTTPNTYFVRFQVFRFEEYHLSRHSNDLIPNENVWISQVTAEDAIVRTRNRGSRRRAPSTTPVAVVAPNNFLPIAMAERQIEAIQLNPVASTSRQAFDFAAVNVEPVASTSHQVFEFAAVNVEPVASTSRQAFERAAGLAIPGVQLDNVANDPVTSSLNFRTDLSFDSDSDETQPPHYQSF